MTDSKLYREYVIDELIDLGLTTIESMFIVNDQEWIDTSKCPPPDIMAKILFEIYKETKE